MSSMVTLPNLTFTGHAQSSKRLNSTVLILSPDTDNVSEVLNSHRIYGELRNQIYSELQNSYEID